jgi:hypothetical protein
MDNSQVKEILHVTTRKDLAESGGGHGQKGVDFQRAWAVERMFVLEKSGAQDFLFLFEAIQDVAELDSPSTPTAIHIYQVKKKDRGEWKWNDLTNLVEPGKTRRASKNPPPDIKDSPIGKLYSSALAFKELKCSGKFISNSGSDLPLESGGNIATSLPCDLSKLEAKYLEALIEGLETLHQTEDLPANPALIHLEKVAIHPDEPVKHLLGTVVVFLTERSPRHAGQALALVDALLAKVGPLGAKTDTFSTFEELKKQRGYSRSEFTSALSDLESVPDFLELLEDWLRQLETEKGIGFWDKPAIRVAASKIYALQVMGGEDPIVAPLLVDIDEWLESNSPTSTLKEFLEKAKADLASTHAGIRSAEFTAHFLLRALKKCAAPI